MIKKINSKLYQPMLFFFLLPIISLVPGTIFAEQFTKINYISLVILYLFIIVNQFIENVLLRIPANNFERSKGFLISLELINLLLILFFWLQYSWIGASILILYTIIIQLQFLFSYYDLENAAAIITSFLKVILLNNLSFYIHTGFVLFRVTNYYLVLFIPYLIYELTRSEKDINKTVFLILSGISYLFATILLWQDIGWLSLSLFVSLPFILTFIKKLDRQYMATFLILFSITYIMLIRFVFFQQ